MPRRLNISILIGVVFLCACSQEEKMRAVMEQMLTEDHEEVIFQSDSIPLRLIDYFTRHGNTNDQMRAYYLLGRSYDCNNNPLLALRFYHEAIMKADTTTTDIDYTTLSRAYAHSSKLFMRGSDNRPMLAIEDARKALHYANMSENEHMIKISRCLLGRAFATNAEWDSMRVYNPELYKSMFRWWEGKDSDYVMHHKSFHYWPSQEINRPKIVVENYQIPLDSLPEYYKEQGVSRFGRRLVHAIEKPTDRDSIMGLSNISSYVDMQLQSQARINRMNTWLIIALAMLLILLITGYMFYRLRREKAKESIKELNMLYSLDLARYQALQSEMKSLMLSSKDKDELIRMKQQQINDMQQQLTSLQEDKQHPNAWHLSEKLLADGVLSN